MKQLMTGDEAIARGAWEAGVTVAAAYPGTPSTEILENIGEFYTKDIYSEWAPNEKVAAEVAIGASIAGARSLCAMKHVGVNVAADPILSFAYSGVNGGFVLVTADDPTMHSSQNEQDNRTYAKFAKIAMIEPSDSQECVDFMKEAYRVSEEFNTSVLFRVTTRVCHSKSLVEVGERVAVEIKPYTRNVSKFVSIPAFARQNRLVTEERLKKLEEYSNTSILNKEELFEGSKIGIITAGISYQYAKEVFGEKASYLKLGFTYPLPMDKIRNFAEKFETVYVIEELEPYMEEQIKAAGIKVIGKEVFPNIFELNPAIIDKAINGVVKEFKTPDVTAASRPPVLCAGCPHRGFFYTRSKKKNIIMTSDIGCYTLGGLMPIDTIDAVLCMGGGFSLAMGMSKAFEAYGEKRTVFGILGDSTFFHSGMTGALDIVYNKGRVVPVVLDNSITGMTGQQENPGTGKTLMGAEASQTDIIGILTSLGYETIRVVDPCDLVAMEAAVDEAIVAVDNGVRFAIVTKRPCVLIKNSPPYKTKCKVITDKCKKCKVCLRVGCPAISFKDGAAFIDDSMCLGCEVCKQTCKFEAIVKVGE